MEESITVKDLIKQNEILLDITNNLVTTLYHISCEKNLVKIHKLIKDVVDEASNSLKQITNKE